MDVVSRCLLSAQEADSLCAAAQSALTAQGSPAHPSFYEGLEDHFHRIPASIRHALRDLRESPTLCALHISGVRVDPERCGPTPLSWQAGLDDDRQALEEAQLALLASFLGSVFAWPTIQRGRMVQNLLPVEKDREEQSGHGSVALEWHTEDGFHPDRCRYLALLGVRNHDRVPTTLGTVHDLGLADDLRAVLRERRFLIRPDLEHLRQLAAYAPDSDMLRQARAMHENPEPVALLFGDPDAPCLRIDAPYTTALPGDDEAAEALAAITGELDRAQRDVVVGEGDVLIVDNYRAVHGRRAFRPRFDGTDRWLKRISVAGRAPAPAMAGAGTRSQAL
ncbi:TauD/TfdA family dioxygenase [Streptomyces pilosus]|uniref:L-asparagine oxygenase n=1 Tax=Streptomyces pilosus TaxID=28893 RepID=A0A918BM67_9ACTN|nr:TauD/TfdA family dioxygenase [Streptomyces pilosus]GGQ73912.1 L-asparagine oxygenase [Streptomyces pilosus]